MRNICIILLFVSFSGYSQKKADKFSAMFYNVENLFDTIDDPHKTDNEFLPGGKNQWNSARLHKKLTNLASVIIAAGRGTMPDVIGMAEVETSGCLQLLINKTTLQRAGYKYILHESEDARGIDVGLLYNSKTVAIIRERAIPIVFPFAPKDHTRDLLYVVAKTAVFDSLHLIVAHLPSRRGGKKKSDEKRFYVATQIRMLTDSIQQKNKHAAIIIMGDFNDRPDDASIQQGLAVSYDMKSSVAKLYGILSENNGEGSYKFQGRWQEIDHFFVSQPILKQAYNARFVKEEFLLEPDERYTGTKPFRTYNGPRYMGGFSDHLPIYIEIKPAQ